MSHPYLQMLLARATTDGLYGGELRTALSLNDGSLVADPFHLTQGAAELLRAYARQVEAETEARASADSSNNSPAMLCVEGGLS